MAAAATNDIFDRLTTSLRVLRGLRNASFRELSQSSADIKQLDSFLSSSYFILARTGDTATNPEYQAAVDAMNPLCMLLGFASTALLHLQQQQRILQAPADDLNLLGFICESLASATMLPNSNPAAASTQSSSCWLLRQVRIADTNAVLLH
jgi:hypothetical protein